MGRLKSTIECLKLLALATVIIGGFGPVHAREDLQAARSATLDDKVYVGRLGEGKEEATGDTFKDTFTFADGEFHSAACDPWGFSPGAYTASKQNGVTHFTAETRSPTDGRMVWDGTAAGGRLRGTMLWHPEPGETPVAYWFSGTAR